MRLDSNPALDCKIKAVNPPFRFVSTPRGRKDLRRDGAVNLELAREGASGLTPASQWSPEQLSERLRTELSRRAWARLVRAAARQGKSVEQLLRACVSEIV
jgi:hypothetical protein